MSRLDAITAVLAIPAVEENGEQRDARPGEAVLDDYVKGLEDRYAEFSSRGDGASELDEIWSELLGQPAIVNDADFGIYEKKGLVYPAILMNPARITAGDDHAKFILTVISDGFCRSCFGDSGRFQGKRLDRRARSQHDY